MDILTLVAQNPWWSDPAAITADQHLQTLGAEPVRWTPRLFHVFQIGEDRVYTVRGPRQVGKTTLVKLLLQRTLETPGVDPRSVLFFSCDLIRDARGLDDLVESYLRWQAPFRLPRRTLFLDEVSGVTGWATAIRALANRGRLRACTLVLTGSHALDVARQVERLPGRRGESARDNPDDLLDKILLPMKFAEYAETQSPRVRQVLVDSGLLERAARLDTFRGLFSERPRPAWSSLQLLGEEAARLLEDYLLTGGFARPLNDLRRHGRIGRETYDLYVRVLTGDLARWDYDERTARDLLAAAIEKMGSPVSWRGLARDAGISSHLTVARYVESLERTFTLQTVYQYDRGKKRRAPRKERKLYVTDPFQFHALRAWAYGLSEPFAASQEFLADRARRGLLLEAVLGDHLARLAFASSPTSLFDAYERVLFWRSKRGWEVDFILRIGDKPLALQLTAGPSRTETWRALRAFGGGLALSERGEAPAIPLAPLLLLI